MSAFNIALSGLTAASYGLDVTANNVANADTAGSRASAPSSPTSMPPAP